MASKVTAAGSAFCPSPCAVTPPGEWLTPPVLAVDRPPRAPQRVQQPLSLADAMDAALANNKDIIVASYLPDEIATAIDETFRRMASHYSLDLAISSADSDSVEVSLKSSRGDLRYRGRIRLRR